MRPCILSLIFDHWVVISGHAALRETMLADSATKPARIACIWTCSLLMWVVISISLLVCGRWNKFQTISGCSGWVSLILHHSSRPNTLLLRAIRKIILKISDFELRWFHSIHSIQLKLCVAKCRPYHMQWDIIEIESSICRSPTVASVPWCSTCPEEPTNWEGRISTITR